MQLQLRTQKFLTVSISYIRIKAKNTIYTIYENINLVQLSSVKFSLVWSTFGHHFAR